MSTAAPWLWLALVGSLAACGSERDPGIEPTASPRYDAVWQIATHNSYWVDRGVTGDLYASGVQERLLDQLLFDRARAVEITSIASRASRARSSSTTRRPATRSARPSRAASARCA